MKSRSHPIAFLSCVNEILRPLHNAEAESLSMGKTKESLHERLSLLKRIKGMLQRGSGLLFDALFELRDLDKPHRWQSPLIVKWVTHQGHPASWNWQLAWGQTPKKAKDGHYRSINLAIRWTQSEIKSMDSKAAGASGASAEEGPLSTVVTKRAIMKVLGFDSYETLDAWAEDADKLKRVGKNRQRWQVRLSRCAPNEREKFEKLRS